MSKAKLSPSKRESVWKKTGGCCAYCGDPLTEETFAVDHVTPKSGGGTNDIANLLPSCKACNSSKGTRSLEDFRLFMAARSATSEVTFSSAQARYLFDSGVFPALGFNDNYQFHFEIARTLEAVA